MVKSKTKIEKQLQKKTNNELVETIIAAKKAKAWIGVASLLSSSKRQRVNPNVEELNNTKGKMVVVAGKVLSQGDMNKKLKIVALGFSEKAKEKLLKTGCEVSTILEEIQKNPEAKDMEIFRK